MADIELGDKARDTISGWKGTVTGRFEYLNGCIRLELAGTGKDGEPEGFVFDEAQVEVVSKAKPKRATLARTGGPRTNTPPTRQ